jgi:hypothetical protein
MGLNNKIKKILPEIMGLGLSIGAIPTGTYITQRLESSSLEEALIIPSMKAAGFLGGKIGTYYVLHQQDYQNNKRERKKDIANLLKLEGGATLLTAISCFGAQYILSKSLGGKLDPYTISTIANIGPGIIICSGRYIVEHKWGLFKEKDIISK